MIMSHIKHKVCPKCKKEKNVEMFYRQGRGYSSYCKDCIKELSRQRVKDGRDKISKIKYEESHGHIRTKAKKRKTDIEKVSYELYRNAKKEAFMATNLLTYQKNMLQK